MKFGISGEIKIRGELRKFDKTVEAKSEKQANILLLGFVVLVIIVSFVLFFGNRTVTLEPAPPDVLPEEF